MTEKLFGNITKSHSNFALAFVGYDALPDKNFNCQCLINNISIPKKVIHIYIYCLFGSVKLTKSTDSDKCKYNRYGIRFDSRSEL